MAMRCDWRTASRAVVGDGVATSGVTTSSLFADLLGLMAASHDQRCRPRGAGVEVGRRSGGGDGSKRLPREDREIFQVPVDLRGFVRLGEQETLTDPDLLQLEALTLLGVFDA